MEVVMSHPPKTKLKSTNIDAEMLSTGIRGVCQKVNLRASDTASQAPRLRRLRCKTFCPLRRLPRFPDVLSRATDATASLCQAPRSLSVSIDDSSSCCGCGRAAAQVSVASSMSFSTTSEPIERDACTGRSWPMEKDSWDEQLATRARAVPMAVIPRVVGTMADARCGTVLRAVRDISWMSIIMDLSASDALPLKVVV